jgi:DNA polymerase
MTFLTCDFETFYSQQFSLSKVTTEEYVRDSRFEAIGVSVKVDDEPAEWFSGTRKQTKAWLDRFDWANSIAIAHNAMFDMAIMNWRFDIRPKRIVDTLSMLRAIDGPDAGNSLAKAAERYGLGVKGTEVVNALGKRRLDFTPEELAAYGDYCINDTEMTYKLAMKLLEGFPKEELQLIDLTMRMFTEPVLYLEKADLELHLADVRRKKADLLGKALISKDNLMSNPQLAETLRSLGVEPPMKISPTTGKETFAFAKSDEEFKALLEHDNVIVQAIIAARLGVKSTLEETRTERFIKIAERGTLPVPLRYYGAHTGRWSGCLVADTVVTVFNLDNGVEEKRITDVLLDDLVWDGEEFVAHEGVVFSGYAEDVVEWDGVRGTEDHVVFTDAGEISLREAMQGEHRLTSGGSPDEDAVDAAGELARKLGKTPPV